MAKRKEKREEQVYETARGYHIRIRPLSGVLLSQIELAVEKEFRERGEPLDAPTYSFETAGGDSEELPYDEETIKKAPDEDVEKWIAYQKAQSLLNEESFKRVLEIAILESFELLDDVEDSWERRQRRVGIEIPEDPDEKLIHLYNTVILGVLDRPQLVTFVQMATYAGSVNDDLVEAAEATFRSALEETRRSITARLAEQEGAELDNVSEVPGDEDSEGVGPESE